jgi:hypothetical protein
MQLTLNLVFHPAASARQTFKNTTWLDAGWAIAPLGFTKKVEISQSLSDALQPFQTDDDPDQHLYDALWLAHHYLVLRQHPSFSFTFDFLWDDEPSGRLRQTSLRLHLEEREHVILLDLQQDYKEQPHA